MMPAERKSKRNGNKEENEQKKAAVRDLKQIIYFSGINRKAYDGTNLNDKATDFS